MIQRLLYQLFFFISPFSVFGQTTKVVGKVIDGATGESMPFVRVIFYDSKIGTTTDSLGNYFLETFYATDSLQFSFFGYATRTLKVKKDHPQELNCSLELQTTETEEVIIRPPDELPSTRLHKKLVANKNINNKGKLQAYEYELYNKIQFDLNNIGDNFSNKGLVQKLDLVMNYLDSTEDGSSYLPIILGESLSHFYFKNHPKKKKEVVLATQITGIENLQLDQFVGDMYLDINVYENYIRIFNKAFVSPAANFARSFYKFFLEDSTFIGSQWCYKLRFKPKRTGDLTFEGEMWITDTTYAIKKIKGSLSASANINYIQGLYFEQEFNLVAPETWMLTNEEMIADIKITENTKIYGLYGRKKASRKYFIINETRPDSFYQTENTVEILPDAKHRDEIFWLEHRHFQLSRQEKGITSMVDSLSKLPVFKTLKNIAYCATTGYYPFGKFELGNISSLFSVNPVEKYRGSVALRTSNKFSKRMEFGGKIAYGMGDQRIKYGMSFRYNLTPKKRGMLTTYYNYDIQQIGQSPTASTVGSTFGTLFRTGPLDKLTFVKKIGINLEKDIKKDLILYGGFEWKEFTPLGLANYVRLNESNSTFDTIKQITTSELIGRFRWTKDEEFIAGSFDRSTLTSRYPIFSLQGIFGIKDLFGGDYSYQKIEVAIDHTTQLGFLGRIRYGLTAGYVFGTAAYPFLKVHEGNQSYYLLTNAFNKLNYFEFVSDKYAGAYVEQHFGGLFFDRIPAFKKLKWRFVGSSRLTYGSISAKNTKEMLLPPFTKQFGSIPYTEAAVGIENIFKVLRIDCVWRLSHLDPGMSPFGLRARMTFNF
jgi:hypothetical protein